MISAGFLFSAAPLTQQGSIGGVFLETRSEFPLAKDSPQRVLKTADAESAPPELMGRAVLVKDTDRQTVLYSKNLNEPMPIASLTKLMTALVVKKLVSPEEMVEITAEDTKAAPYKINLEPHEKILVKDLLKAMLIASANDAALALARHAAGDVSTFVRFMNREAKQLKMKNTSFQNPVGFDDPNHFSSASDLALLVEEFMRNPDLMEIVGQKEALFYSVDGVNSHRLVSTNKLLDNSSVLGIKTGYTNEAKGNIIILVGDEKYYFIILGSPNREEDAEKLMVWMEANFEWQ